MSDNHNANGVQRPVEQVEHFSLYPLPENRRGPQNEYFKKVLTTDSGEVLVLEFDFNPVEPFGPFAVEPQWEELERLIPHNCSTCEWVSLRDKGTVYCSTPIIKPEDTCREWELSSDALNLVKIEYYKSLHKKHYGTTCISVR